jgi:SAM-dependent methyltransferase
VADFACGAGHQTLHLAHHFRDATFVLIDFKARSLAVAERRANAAGLANVRCVRGRVEDFDEPFDVGVALHACGGASDAAMRKCVEANAAFVIAPCCVGKIAPGEGGERAVALARARREARRRAKAEAKANGAEAEAKANDASFAAAASSSSSDADSDSDPFEDRRQSRETYPRSALASGVTTAEAYVAIARAADHADDEAEAEEEEEDAGGRRRRRRDGRRRRGPRRRGFFRAASLRRRAETRGGARGEAREETPGRRPLRRVGARRGAGFGARARTARGDAARVQGARRGGPSAVRRRARV